MKQRNEVKMTTLTTTAVRSLIGLFGGRRASRPAPAPWMRHRPTEHELERLRIAESHVPYRF